MRLCLPLILLFALATAPSVRAQDTHDWNSLAKLKPGDQVRISSKARSPVTGEFRNWTPEQVTIGNQSEKQQEVLKVERYRPGGWSRGKSALVGALIGFGGGFAIGAAAAGSCGHQFGPCFSRGEVGAAIGGAGAVVGAVVGAVLPHHHKELIYAAR